MTMGREPPGQFLISYSSSRVSCSRLSDSRDESESYVSERHANISAHTQRRAGGGGKKEVSSRFIFVFVLSQFLGPRYLRAWNRLWLKESQRQILKDRIILDALLF